MSESVYDRLKYLLVERRLREGEISLMAETMIKELKLFPTKAVRLHQKFFHSKDPTKKPIIRAK